MNNRTIILGVIGADCHSVGNKILERFYGEAGFNVVNLGVLVSQEEFIEAAKENGAGAILVSSLYGHGEIDCQGLRTRCQEQGLGSIVLHVGGNLAVGKQDRQELVKKFREMGYDRVYSPDIPLERCLNELRQDLHLPEAKDAV
jgi:methylaspartate mutase sigma subunit